MTNVIAFKARERRERTAPETPCQILFFTGVRYMREEAVKVVRPRKATRKKRA